MKNKGKQRTANKRGQVAIEFIFLVLVVIIYLTTTAQPVIRESKDIAMDIDKLTRTNNETNKLADAILRVSMRGIGTAETIILIVPEDLTNREKDSVIYCHFDGNIGFRAYLKNEVVPENYPTQCPLGYCDKNFLEPERISVDCSPITAGIKGLNQIIVKKTAANTVKITLGK